MSAPRLTAEQKRVVRAIKRRAKVKNASPMEIKAAIETGIVENNLTDRDGGDRDSNGWRQSRASIYGNPGLEKDIDNFFDETRAVKAKYGRAGDLAAAVQRPAAQYRGRYQDRSEEADAILRQFGVTRGGKTASKGGRTRTTTRVIPGDPDIAPGSDGTMAIEPVADRKARGSAALNFLQGRTDAIGLALEIKNQKASELADAYAVQKGAEGIEGTPDTTVKTTVKTPGRTVKVGGSRKPARATGQRKLGGGPAGAGKIEIFNANPGRLNKPIVNFSKEVSAIYGKPLRIDSGAGHSVNTATGNRSQHTDGDATDIPARGKELLRMGRAALIAAGMPRAQALKETGGLYNVNGHQIIFHDRQHLSGSAHDDHLHISAR